MGKLHKPKPRFKVGDWVTFLFGPNYSVAKVIEDRGCIGSKRTPAVPHRTPVHRGRTGPIRGAGRIPRTFRATQENRQGFLSHIL